MINEDETASFESFRDCISTLVIERLAPDSCKRPKKRVKGRKKEIKPVLNEAQKSDEGVNDGSELSDFIEYLAEEVFGSLPKDLRTLSFVTVQNNVALTSRFALPLDTAVLEDVTSALPPSTIDSLTSYNLVTTRLDQFLDPVLTQYITTLTAPPPEYAPAATATRPDACEICERGHLPLTYHHLIPRSMHSKAMKRGWHSEWQLHKVAWLCRACHSYVHNIATNETLARELNSVELLMEREDVQRWAAWVGKIRWKAR